LGPTAGDFRTKEANPVFSYPKNLCRGGSRELDLKPFNAAFKSPQLLSKKGVEFKRCI
jgi:hypothetical protein